MHFTYNAYITISLSTRHECGVESGSGIIIRSFPLSPHPYTRVYGSDQHPHNILL